MQVEEVEEEASLEVSLDPSCLEEEKIPGFPGPSSTCSWVNTKTVGLQVTLTSMLVHLGWVVIIVLIIVIIVIIVTIVIIAIIDVIGIIAIIVILMIKGCIEYLTGAESFGASEFSFFATGGHHLGGKHPQHRCLHHPHGHGHLLSCRHHDHLRHHGPRFCPCFNHFCYQHLQLHCFYPHYPHHPHHHDHHHPYHHQWKQHFHYPRRC